MNYVEPIRKKRDIEIMKEELKKNGTRDYLLFVFGINVGLRISDIINLKVEDVMDYTGEIKKHLEVREEKTKKIKRFKINPMLAEELYQYVRNLNMTDYIFQSRNGNNSHITRERAYTILNNAAINIGLQNIGTHTLRRHLGIIFINKLMM